MACGTNKGAQPEGKAQPIQGPVQVPPAARPGTRRIPYGNRSSGLMSQGAPLGKPGYTGSKFPYTLKRPGSRVLATYNPETIQPGKQEIRPLVPPLGRRSALSSPGEPTTTQPLHLARVDRGQYFYDRYPLRPGVGDALPVQGQVRYIAQGLPGGINYPMRFAYTGIDLPMDLVAKQRRKLFEKEVRRARLAAKRFVVLKPGLSGREAATARRGKPGAPGGVVGAGPSRWGRPTQLRGTLVNNDRVPLDVLEQMARDAVSVNP